MKSFSERMLEVKIEQSRKKLIDRIESLRNRLDIELKQISGLENYHPNELGIVQSLGQEIDVLCGKLGALYEMKDVMEADTIKE